MDTSLAVITVVYNNYDDLSDYLASFKAQSLQSFHIFIVDVSSKPQEYQYPSFVTRITNDNKGYAYGLNVGLNHALTERYNKFVFMNNDTTVDKNFVKAAITAIETHPSTLIGGKIYYSSGYEFHAKRYSTKDAGNVLWYAGGIMDWNNAWGVHRGVDEVDTQQYDTVEKTEFVTGCLMVFDKALVDKAGKIDDSYFMYYEDTDWNQQIRKAGCSIIYDPHIIIWHKNAQSTGGSGSKFHQKYQTKNRLKFGMRYAPLRTKLHLLKNYALDFLK